MMTMRNAISTVLLLGALSACGEPEPAFMLRIQTTDVIALAVDRVDVELQPQMMQRFACRPDEVYFNGGARTRVTGVDCAIGTFLIQLERGYLDANRGIPDDVTIQWYVDLPLYSEVTERQAMTDLLLDVRFYRRDVKIADGQRFVTWPLLPGAIPSPVTVQCDRMPVDRGAECSNNDPLPMTDAGTAGGDGG